MIEVFADTGYWIALLSPRDELHRRAMSAHRRFEFSKIVTSELVLAELLNHMSNSGNVARTKAVQLWKRAHSEITVIDSSATLLEAAVEFYNQHADKSWSLSDCASFIIMRKRSVHDALTFDEHFQQAGFRALLRED